jgi:hypothetical protein
VEICVTDATIQYFEFNIVGPGSRRAIVKGAAADVAD